LAITKDRKNELVEKYIAWVNESQVVILTEYSGLTMKQLDDLRSKSRDAGGEFHIVKNTLGEVAFKQMGIEQPETFLAGSTAVAFAFKDAPALAKVLQEYARTNEFVKIKGGLLEKHAISANDVKSLAELPPLPVVRAQLLGVLLAPASKLVRTLAEPARQVASVLKAYSEKDSAAVPAEAPAA
jgi:large subunit ribosomal protein L10